MGVPFEALLPYGIIIGVRFLTVACCEIRLTICSCSVLLEEGYPKYYGIKMIVSDRGGT